MEPHAMTTPFGRRSLTLAQVAAQATAKARAADARAHKWEVFRDLCAAREKLALSERALAVLDALLTFHPETVLSGADLVVFPSNAQLTLRAHGMAPSTLRRHLGALVEAGLVIRRDSPNGKRYARRGQGGEISLAFGFDLAPLVARAQEFAALADEARAEARAARLARERLSLLRRDLAKTIAAGLEAGAPLPGGWPALHADYRRLVESLPRTAGTRERESVADALAQLLDLAAKALETHVNAQNKSANESQIERHKQNSKPESSQDSEPLTKAAGRGEEPIALPLVLRACPDIADYARSGVANWGDLAAAAGVARAALGVSPSAWEAARAAMGERAASATLAAILQRSAVIASPGGYLRELTRKAEANAFSVGPMLMALYRDSRPSSSISPSRDGPVSPQRQSTRLRSSAVAPGAKLRTSRPS